MTLNDIYLSALELMGYSYSYAVASEHPFLSEPLKVCNLVLIDLKIPALSDINEELKLSDELLEALVFGVAMLLALYFGDSIKHSMFTDIYNAKRKECFKKTKIETITDVMPGGVV